MECERKLSLKNNDHDVKHVNNLYFLLARLCASTCSISKILFHARINNMQLIKRFYLSFFPLIFNFLI